MGRRSVRSREGWLRGVDLNHRPLGYEPNELPGCSTPQLHLNNSASATQDPAELSFGDTESHRQGERKTPEQKAPGGWLRPAAMPAPLRANLPGQPPPGAGSIRWAALVRSPTRPGAPPTPPAAWPVRACMPSCSPPGARAGQARLSTLHEWAVTSFLMPSHALRDARWRRTHGNWPCPPDGSPQRCPATRATGRPCTGRRTAEPRRHPPEPT